MNRQLKQLPQARISRLPADPSLERARRTPSVRAMALAAVVAIAVTGCSQTSSGPGSSQTSSGPGSSQTSSRPQTHTSAGAFEPTGSMTTGRIGDAAVLLKDGRVLVVGGDGGQTSELYDPTSGKFTATGPMTAARENPTATLLPDGRVLIAGGDPAAAFGDGRLASAASAELYDPNTGKFSPTGSMTGPHSGQTAILLSTGKVLMAGGTNLENGKLATAELFDPNTGKFSPTGSMDGPARQALAFPLSDGRVFLSLGSEAEIYNPNSGTFDTDSAGLLLRDGDFEGQTGNMLPNGHALLVGGLGFHGTLLYDAVECSVPLADTAKRQQSGWAPDYWFEPHMITLRLNHTATLLSDGRVLVAGGKSFYVMEGIDKLPEQHPTGAAELYDYRTHTFTSTGSLATPRTDATAVALMDGRVLVLGGEDIDNRILASAELWIG